MYQQIIKERIATYGVNTITEKEIIEWLRLHVSTYQLPREIEFIEQLPYTTLGKLNRKQLKDMNTNTELFKVN